MKVSKILEIVEAHEICGCNICSKRHNEVKIHEIRLGMDNHSNVTFMCTECLNEFSDNLWKYLEEQTNEKRKSTDKCQ